MAWRPNSERWTATVEKAALTERHEVKANRSNKIQALREGDDTAEPGTPPFLLGISVVHLK